MIRPPSIRSLRAFEAAARHGGYSAAAEELGLTHGAISHRIREMEENLGVPLFRRVGRGMTLTPEGIALLAQVREILLVIQRAFPSRLPSSGSLVVSVHPAFANCWLLPRIGDFISQNPEIDIEVRSPVDVGSFLGPGVDVAIQYGSGEWPSRMCEHLEDEEVFPVCTPAFRDQHGLRSPSDLLGCPLLRHAWQPWAGWFKAAGLALKEPSRGLMVSDTAMLLAAARAGEGVALSRRLMVTDDLAAGRLVRLFDVTVSDSFGYYMTWPLQKPLSGEGVRFKAWISKALRETRQVVKAGASDKTD